MIMKVALGVVLAFILLIGGCLAVVGGLASVDDGTTTGQATTTVEDSDGGEDPAPVPNMTVSQGNALRAAEAYLETAPFSRSGLIDQLKFEGYAAPDARFAAGHVQVSWRQQAARAAKAYLETAPFSRSGLIDQLMFEGYTREQAEHGATQAGL